MKKFKLSLKARRKKRNNTNNPKQNKWFSHFLGSALAACAGRTETELAELPENSIQSPCSCFDASHYYLTGAFQFRPPGKWGTVIEALGPRFITVRKKMYIVRDLPHIYFSTNSYSPTIIWWPGSGLAISLLKGFCWRTWFCSAGTWGTDSREHEVFWNVRLTNGQTKGNIQY